MMDLHVSLEVSSSSVASGVPVSLIAIRILDHHCSLSRSLYSW